MTTMTRIRSPSNSAVSHFAFWTFDGHSSYTTSCASSGKSPPQCFSFLSLLACWCSVYQLWSHGGFVVIYYISFRNPSYLEILSATCISSVRASGLLSYHHQSLLYPYPFPSCYLLPLVAASAPLYIHISFSRPLSVSASFQLLVLFFFTFYSLHSFYKRIVVRRVVAFFREGLRASSPRI